MIRSVVAWVLFLTILPSSLFSAIRGVVIDAEGKPISGATVNAYPTRSDQHTRLGSADATRPTLAASTTATDGSFTIDVKGVSFAHVQFSKPGFAPAGRNVPVEWDLSGVMLRNARSVPIRVARSGKPITDAIVTLTGSETVLELPVDAEGIVNAPDPAVWKPRVAVYDRSARTYWLSEMPLTTTSISVPANVTIEGKVLSTDGKTGVAGIDLFVDEFASAVSAEDGSFRIVASPIWKFLVAKKDARVAVTSRIVSHRGAISLRLVSATTLEVNVQMKQTPIAGASVLAHSRGEGPPTWGVTDAKGNVTLHLTPGRYTVSSAVPGALTESLELSTARGEKLARTFSARPFSIATGVVANEEGRPIAAARILSTNAGGQAWPRSDAPWSTPAGTFSLSFWDDGAEKQVHAVHKRFPAAKSERFRANAGRKDNLRITMPAGFTVTGRVVGGEGKGLEGVDVITQELNDDPQRQYSLDEMQTNDKGEFSLVRAEGKYQFRFTKRGFAAEIINQVAVGKLTAPVQVVMKPGVEISGRVVRSGVGVPDVSIYTGQPNAGEFTSGDGSFVVRDLKAGPINLSFRSNDQSIELQRTVDAPANDLLIEIPPGAKLSGRVIDKESKSPVKDFQAGLGGARSAGGMMRMGSASLRNFSSEEGLFTLENLRPGTAEVEVRAAGYAPATFPGVVLEDGKTHPSIEVQLERGAKVSGKITTEAGLAIEDASVAVERVNEAGGGRSMSMTDHSRTNDRGEFLMEGLAAGELTLVASRAGYVAERKVVAIAKGENRVDLKLVKGIEVEGRVETESGSVVADAQIMFGGVDVRSGGQARSDSNGSFRVAGLAAGRYRVSARKTGLAPSDPLEVDVTSSSSSVRLILKRGGVLTGRVVGLSAAELAKAQVTARAQFPWTTSPVDDKGNFRLEGLAKGTLFVAASTEGPPRREVTRSVEMTDGEEKNIDFEFKAGHRITGRVTRGDQPVSGARVSWMSSAESSTPGNDARSSASTTSRADGSYSVDLQTEGVYDVSVFDQAAFTRKLMKHTVSSSGQFDVDLRGAGLRGRVLQSSTREPISNATIIVQRRSSDNSQFNDETGVSSPAGEFTIDTVPEGTYQVRAKKEGFTSEPREVVVSATGAEVELLLAPAADFRMKLVDHRSGKLVAGSILVFDAAGRVTLEGSLRESGDGDYKVGLAPGQYTLVAGTYSLGTRSVRVSIPGPPLTIALGPVGALQVQNTSGSRRKFRFVTPAGENHFVSTWSRSPEIEIGSTLQRWEFFTAGEYLLQILDADGKVSKTKPVNVLPGRENTVTLD